MPGEFNLVDYFSRILVKGELADYGTTVQAGDYIPLVRNNVPGFVDPSTFIGTQGPAGADGAAGSDGLSAYEIWIAEGNSGPESTFLASLVGPIGPTGMTGAPGGTVVNEGTVVLTAATTTIDLTGAESVINAAVPAAESGNPKTIRLLKDDMEVGKFYPLLFNIDSNGSVVTFDNLFGDPDLGMSSSTTVINEVPIAAVLRDGAQTFTGSTSLQVNKASLLPDAAHFAFPLQGKAEMFRHSDNMGLAMTLQGNVAKLDYVTAVPRGIQFNPDDTATDPKFVIANPWAMTGDSTIYFELIYRSKATTRWLFGADSAGSNNAQVGFYTSGSNILTFYSTDGTTTQSMNTLANLVVGNRYRFKWVRDTVAGNYFLRNITLATATVVAAINASARPSDAQLTNFFIGGKTETSSGGLGSAANDQVVCVVLANGHITTGSAEELAVYGWMDATRELA